MLTLKKLTLGLISAAFLSIISSPAKAINITTGGITAPGQGQVSAVPGSISVNFDNGQLPSSGPVIYSPFTNDPAIVTGNIGGLSQPADDNTPYLAVAPLGNAAGVTGAVTINFAQTLDYFGLYWGSIDAFNFIRFFNNNTVVGEFSGSNIPGTGDLFVNFFADPGETFNRIILSSSAVGFESDNHAFRLAQVPTQVPEPASILALLACAALGANSLVKQKSKAA
ncbi:MAG TPA: PEP-CTERM sorting domain-containing protein [Nostocaceae cyanobacterium]|nr:PEP-CTERM sorting domain-containing protein [Nostocaceae cyanobacterium]